MAKKENSNERATFTTQVKAVRGDIFKVLSKGTCIEWTDQIKDAQQAFREADKPKTMFKIMRATGAVSKLQEQIL